MREKGGSAPVVERMVALILASREAYGIVRAAEIAHRKPVPDLFGASFYGGEVRS